VRDLLEEVVVLEHRRAAVADGAVVLVVDDRVALRVVRIGGVPSPCPSGWRPLPCWPLPFRPLPSCALPSCALPSCALPSLIRAPS
jgi:hypothetical protein